MLSENASHKITLARSLKTQRQRLTNSVRKGLVEAIAFIQDTRTASKTVSGWVGSFALGLNLPSGPNGVVLPSAFTTEEIDTYVADLSMELAAMDREENTTAEVQVADVFSLSDDVATGLLTSNLF